MQIQVNIPKELNKKLKIEKVKKDFKTLQETVIRILEIYFKNVRK